MPTGGLIEYARVISAFVASASTGTLMGRDGRLGVILLFYKIGSETAASRRARTGTRAS